MSQLQQPNSEYYLPAQQVGSGSANRRMVAAELLGQHTHHTVCGKAVHVWLRDGKYLARGRYRGHAFGQGLGSEEREAGGKCKVRRALLSPTRTEGRHLPENEAVREPAPNRRQPAAAVPDFRGPGRARRPRSFESEGKSP